MNVEILDVIKMERRCVEVTVKHCYNYCIYKAHSVLQLLLKMLDFTDES